MIDRTLALAMLVVAWAYGGGSGQEPAPATPAGIIPPDRNLPPHIRQLTGFGERADFSPDGQRVLFLSKTFGDRWRV